MTMSNKERARCGAMATNKVLTPEIRSKAAKKGWKRRKKLLLEKLSQRKKKDGR